eukprot:TRINITY_DN65740_c0_g1_i1.p1 TRINITY_DN65740_c0_g1~~TRINITY_DN65740_c0_g1_i1.p1  ORF type:complete len:100 (+),score=2.03 TRINITY_DN65740_c0_g1_i1:373-672(+)
MYHANRFPSPATTTCPRMPREEEIRNTLAGQNKYGRQSRGGTTGLFNLLARGGLGYTTEKIFFCVLKHGKRLTAKSRPARAGTRHRMVWMRARGPQGVR